MTKAILFHLCVSPPPPSLSLTHTHRDTDTQFSSSHPHLFFFKPTSGFQISRLCASAAVNPSYSPEERESEWETETEKISFFVTSLQLSFLTSSDWDSACVCNSQKMADPKALKTIRTCSWKNNRFISGSCSSHTYLCFSFSQRRKTKEKKKVMEFFPGMRLVEWISITRYVTAWRQWVEALKSSHHKPYAFLTFVHYLDGYGTYMG